MQVGNAVEAENSAAGGINCRAIADHSGRKGPILLSFRGGTALADSYGVELKGRAMRS